MTAGTLSATEWVDHLIERDQRADRFAIAPWFDYEPVLRGLGSLADAGREWVTSQAVAEVSGQPTVATKVILETMAENGIVERCETLSETARSVYRLRRGH